MQIYLCEALRLRHLDERAQMLERCVDVRLGEQAGEVDRAAAPARVGACGLEHGVLEECAVLDGHRDLGVILIDDLAGAEREVADLTIAGLAPREPDGDAGRLQARERIIFGEPRERRRLSHEDRVCMVVPADAPSVEHYQHCGFLCHSFILDETRRLA